MSKKKILLLSDDLRMHSGVAVMSHEIVKHTLHKYDWVQIAGAIEHPEVGKIQDMSQVAEKEWKIKDPYLKLYPVNGYGDPQTLRQVIGMEKPDAILHYTDPRFWIWLYQMEGEIRKTMPIFFYTIWDDLPYPQYNRNYYLSCDLLMAISKQSYNICKKLVPEYKDWQITYVPHGIDTKKYFPVSSVNTEFIEFKSKFTFDKYEYLVLYSNRNIRRKQPGDVALAFQTFVDSLPEDKRSKAALIWHCAPVDENGTDLPRMCKHIIPDCNVIFTYPINNGPFDDKQMNFLYNSCDVYINLASNEGFGLGSLQALAVGKPIIVNVTGGLQDQCGFELDKKPLTEDDYLEIHSLHNHKLWKTNSALKSRSWAFPIWPTNRSLQGSPPTPYIFDDRCDYEDAGEQLLNVYNLTDEQKDVIAKEALEFIKDENISMTAPLMGKRFIESMETAFDNWKPVDNFRLEEVA
tara:strand:- start:2761 stop:4149 length:1389 start_codon:yes stop_codon:yes gene_type:complete